MSLLRKAAALLPAHWQAELKRFYYRRQITRGIFRSPEPEYDILSDFIAEGDWVLDVGANVGHYTRRFSELVGVKGRVIAFEPMPATFSLLAANVQAFAHANVTLMNVAVSDCCSTVSMSVPRLADGSSNYYEAHISSVVGDCVPVVTVPIDALGIDRRIALVKIDTEGHELFVINGMSRIIQAQKPVLIVETNSKETVERLIAFGYAQQRLPGSPNCLFRPIP